MKIRTLRNPYLRAFVLSLSTGLLSYSLQPAAAATRTKLDNLDDLNLTSSWFGGIVPTSTDVATWNSTVTGANSVNLGASLSFGGIAIASPGGAVTINAGNTLTLGTSGIDMSAATQNLTISSGLTMAGGGQTWAVASGRTLTLNTGSFSRTAGASLALSGSGSVVSTMTGLTSANLTNGILPWATVGTGTSSRFGVIDGGGNITGYTGATPLVAWTTIPAGTGGAAVNYESSLATASAYGNARTFNSLRYTGTGGSLTGSTMTTNAIMHAGGGTFNITSILATGSSGELVLNAASGPITVSSVISGTGAVVLNGPNTVTFSAGVKTYQGSTNVNNGTLILSGGSINATSGIRINGSGAKFTFASATAGTAPITLTRGTFDGVGTVGAVTVGAGTGGTLTNGNGGTGTLTMSSLIFGGVATVNANVGGTTPFAVTGNLTSSGGTGAATVNLSGTFSTGSTYNIISYGGTYTGTAATDFLVGSGLSSRQAGASTFSSTGGSNGFIVLNVNGDSPVWSGAGSGFWQTATTGDNSGANDWATKNAHTGTNFWVTDTAEFNDTYNAGAGNVAPVTSTVTVHGGNVSPGSTTFNNSAVNYTLTSDGGFGIATGSLTKNGSGTLTLDTANTTSGATVVHAGTLVESANGLIADNSPLTVDGTGTFSLGNNHNDTVGTVTLDGAGQITGTGTSALSTTGTFELKSGPVSGTLAGTGAVNKTTGGTVTISTPQTYTGATAVNAGTLAITGSLGNTAVSLNTGGTLSLDAANAINQNTLTFNGGTLTQSVDNAIGGFAAVNAKVNTTLSRNNNFSGGVIVNSGTNVVVTVTNPQAAGTGYLVAATGATTPSFLLHMDGGGTISTPIGFSGSTNVNTVIDVANNGSGTNGIISLSKAGSTIGNQILTVTGSNGYKLSIASLSATGNNNFIPTGAFSAYPAAKTVILNPTSAALIVGDLTQGTTGHTFYLDGTNAGNQVTGSITDGALLTGLNVVKSGSSTWALNGSSTYTGTTTVSAGTLLVNGSLGNTSSVTGTGGTLGGTGSIAAPVTLSGSATLSPGASIESLATGALTMTTGTTLLYEAANNSSTGGDLLVVNGALSLTGVTLDLTAASLGLNTWLAGDKLTLISYTGADITSGFTGYLDDTIYTFGDNQWLFNYNDTTAGNNFQSEATGNAFVTMTFVPVPEPGSLLLGSLGILALFRRRR